MNRIIDSQIRLNQRSRDAWDCVRGHRENVMAMLLQAAGKERRLCVLGAGNCNDIDLLRLAESYAEVVLVDIDREAIESGVAKQFSNHFANDLRTRIQIAPACDLSRITDQLSQATATDLDRAAVIQSICQRLQASPSQTISRSFDVVASVCLLSQLIFSVNEAMGVRADTIPIIQALRHHHLRLLTNTTLPGGTGILITDFVSSATAPELNQLPNNLLPEVVRQMLQQQNFFTGLNPEVIAHQLRHNEELTSSIESIYQTDPWIWNFGARHYAVCGFAMQRSRG